MSTLPPKDTFINLGLLWTVTQRVGLGLPNSCLFSDGVIYKHLKRKYFTLWMLQITKITNNILFQYNKWLNYHRNINFQRWNLKSCFVYIRFVGLGRTTSSVDLHGIMSILSTTAGIYKLNRILDSERQTSQLHLWLNLNPTT